VAQGLRPRSVAGPRAAVLVLLAACGNEQGPRPPDPRAVDTAALADAAVVDAVLDECHRPLRGGLDRIAATIRLPDGTEARLFAQLPDKLRAIVGREPFLAIGDRVVRLAEGDAGDANADDAARVLRLRSLLDAATLGPLHRATACRRVGPATFDVEQPDGSTTRLELRAGTLLPQSFANARGIVNLREHFRTPANTWIVTRAELDGLGSCAVQFEFADLAWDTDFFALPRERATKPDRARMQMPLASGEPRSTVPVLVDFKAAQRVVVDDPGTWSERAAIYAPLHTEVERQDQQIAGFPQLWTENGRRRLGLCFRRRVDGPEFARPDGWNVMAVPEGKWLVVYPANGDVDAKIAAGTAALEAGLTELGLRATGPITSQPFLHLQEGAPDAAKLEAPVVRVAVPVR